jgi:ABC-type Fe3+ transport system substrate-binding protein
VPKSIGAAGIKSWEELLDPKYDGKIIMRDPRASGNGFTTAMFLNFNDGLGKDFIRRFFAGGRVVFSNDERQNVEWTEAGRMQVAIYPRTQEVEALQKIGGMIETIPALTSKGKLISSVSSTDGIIFLPKLNPLPHPNAAKLYLNWFYSRAGQQAMVDILGTGTYRVDVDQSKLSAGIKPVQGITYLNMNDENFANPEVIKQIRDTVAEAVKK